MIRELTEQELKQRALLNERLKGRKPREHNFDDFSNPLLDEYNPFIPNYGNSIELLPPPGSGLTYRIDESGYIHCEEYNGD